MMPLTPAPADRMPPSVYSQMIDSALVMVTAPKPPGSRQLISPPAAVLEMAPAKVLQGAVRLHGLTSSPTPDTQVRVACAKAGVACMAVAPSSAAAYNIVLTDFVVISIPLRIQWSRDLSASRRLCHSTSDDHEPPNRNVRRAARPQGPRLC